VQLFSLSKTTNGLISISSISRLVEDFPEIEEMDINPFVVFEREKSCTVLDARIKVGRSFEHKRF
jgi:hypothetical protein